MPHIFHKYSTLPSNGGKIAVYIAVDIIKDGTTEVFKLTITLTKSTHVLEEVVSSFKQRSVEHILLFISMI